MKELVEYLVKSLVDEPDKVMINEITIAKSLILQLKVAPEDVGKVIGKQGKIINAIRTILNAATTKSQHRVVLEILD